MEKGKKFKQLSDEERFTIEKLLSSNKTIREIASILGRSPNTISYEIKQNSVNKKYTKDKAKAKSRQRRIVSKRQCLKVGLDSFLSKTVEGQLKEKLSPKQISGQLRKNRGIICSDKAIYKFVESRNLEHLLFSYWSKKKPGSKRSKKHKKINDNRKYIESRPELKLETGHYEMDFIVSKFNNNSFLVLVDRVTKMTIIDIIENRKHSTVLSSLNKILKDKKVRSITTDNDISFSCWKDIEESFDTQVYFTRPYHSWEKGLVENTNRWIRAFVPKRRDIATVTEDEVKEILCFLNDRPREIIDFMSPREYNELLS